MLGLDAVFSSIALLILGAFTGLRWTEVSRHLWGDAVVLGLYTLFWMAVRFVIWVVFLICSLGLQAGVERYHEGDDDRSVISDDHFGCSRCIPLEGEGIGRA